MARNMEFDIVIGSSVTGVLAGFSKMAESLKNVKDKTEELYKTSKKLEAFDQASKKMIAINKEYSKAVEHLKMLQEAQKKSGNSGHLLNEQIKKQEQVINKLNKQKERQNHVFKAARSSIEQEGYALKGYKESLEKVNKKLEINNRLKVIQSKHESRISNLNRLESHSDKYLKRGAVAGAMALAPLKVYMDVEESQADLRKMLGNEAQKYYGKLREISDNSPLSQPQVFEIAGSLAQSGIDGKDLVEYTKKANQIALAFNMGTEEAGEFLAKTKAQLNLGTKELFAYADTINYLSDNTASKAIEITEISQRVASLGGIAGVSRESVADFGATLVSAGVGPERASTGLKNLYVDLSKGASATNTAKKAFESLGLSAEKLAKDMQKNGEGSILDVLRRIKQMPKEMQTATINQIFGQEAIDSVSGLVNNLDMLETNLKKSKSEMANGAVEREYASIMATLGTEIKVLRNQLMNSVADLGLALAPSIKQILTDLTPLIENFATWIKHNPKLAQGIMKVIGMFALFNLGLGGAMKFGLPFVKTLLTITNTFSKLNAAGGLVKGFSTVFPTLSKFGKLLTSGVVRGFMGIIKVIKFIGVAIKAAFIANPIGVIVIAIIAVIAILVVLYNKNKAFRDFVNKMWKSITKWAVVAWNWIKSSAIAAFNYLKPFINIWIRNIVAYFKFIWTVAKNVFKMLSSYIKMAIDVWKGIFNLFIAFFTGKWNEIPGIVRGIWESVKTGMNGFVNGAKEILKGLFDWFGSKWENIGNRAGELANKINPLNWGKNYTGTNYWKGGLTSVAERGPELINIPGQSPFLAQSEMMLNLPRGTQILNNSQTRNSLKDRVRSLKDRVSNLKNSNNSSGGDNITININVNGGSSPKDIAREIERILRERDNKRRRVEFG